MDDFEELFRIIESHTGIQVNESHKKYVINFVNKRIALNSKRFSSVYEYTLYLQSDQVELDLLIDEAAINETYFFREESHFDYLRQKIFPSYVGRPLFIWSAACSSGEEAVSLYTLAKCMGCKPIMHCTDIDSHALETLESACWKKSSFRSDGDKYTELMMETGTFSADGETWNLFRTEVQNFKVKNFNLVTDTQLPFPAETMDIIFLRNVFIYFSRENQLLVLKKMYNALKPGGLLFLSINEIAGLDDFDGIPFVKDHDGAVYFLKKLSPAEYENYQKNNSRSFRDATAKKVAAQRSASEKETASRRQQPAITKTPVPSPVKPVSTLAQPAANAFTQAKPDSNNALEKMAHRFLDQVSVGNYETAKTLIEEHPFNPQNLEYKFFLYGRLYNHSGDQAKEQSILNKSVIINPKFWPGWFSLGMLYKNTGQNSKVVEAFTKARDLLRTAASENRMEPDFIVESFDLSYFINLADNYLKAIGE